MISLLMHGAFTAVITVLVTSVIEFFAHVIDRKLFWILFSISLIVLLVLFIFPYFPVPLTTTTFKTHVKEDSEKVPSAAAIYLDGKLMGQTPKESHYQLWGPHILWVEREHYHAIKEPISIMLYKSQTIDFQLEAKKGSILVDLSRPSEVLEIVIKKDQEEVDRFTTDTDWRSDQLKFGTYSVYILKGGKLIAAVPEIHLYSEKSHDIRF